MKRVAAVVLPLILTVGAVLAQDASPAESASPDNSAGAGAALAACGGGLVFFLIWLAVYLAGAIWVTKDAKRRNSPNATLVTVLTWIPPTWLIGIIVHLVTRPKTTTTTT